MISHRIECEPLAVDPMVDELFRQTARLRREIDELIAYGRTLTGAERKYRHGEADQEAEEAEEAEAARQV